MIASRINLALAARPHDVAGAILLVAEKEPPLWTCFFSDVGRSDGKRRGEMCGVFFKTTRFELLDGGHFWLSTSPEKPGSLG